MTPDDPKDSPPPFTLPGWDPAYLALLSPGLQESLARLVAAAESRGIRVRSRHPAPEAPGAIRLALYGTGGEAIEPGHPLFPVVGALVAPEGLLADFPGILTELADDAGYQLGEGAAKPLQLDPPPTPRRRARSEETDRGEG